MESAGRNLQEETATEVQKAPESDPAISANGKPVWIEPDADFIRRLSRQSGTKFLMCMQCGTCSATCALSPDTEPFPRKELAWARWGMKDRLLRDADIWLCYQCQDCSSKCPRGARPGEVLGAIRQECVVHYSWPRFLGRWVNQPQGIPLLLAIPVVLLTLALFLVTPIEKALGLSVGVGERIVYSYSSMFPHWMLNLFFGFFGLLAVLVMVAGALRFWKALKHAIPQGGRKSETKGVGSSVIATLKNVIMHRNFDQCETTKTRQASHLCVFFGFIALFAVSLWVFTSGINPFIYGDFVYPFGFWSPWKMLANLGGIALVVGCLLMIQNRYKNRDLVGPGGYFDWALISALLLAAFSGFATEVLHYLRLEPHRHLAYFAHLVFAFTVIIYLPYSKLAHLAYRFTALVYAEYSGRSGSNGADEESREKAGIQEERAEHVSQ